MEKLPSEFAALYRTAKELLATDEWAQQALVLRTASGQLMHCANHRILSGDGSEEAAFIKLLAEIGETEITHAVCMWHDFTLDVPSNHMRRQLEKLHPRNKETKILLAGDGSFVGKTLRELE